MANAFKDLLTLLKNDKYYIGTVISINTTSKNSRIRLLSGNIITAFGTNVAIGNNCIVENGFIKQEIPVGPIYEVEI